MMIVLLITLLDGSQIHLKTSGSHLLTFQTQHGTLKVPLKSVRECTFGVHVDNPKRYETYAAELGGKYGERDAATKFFKENRRGAYKYLLPLKDSADQEVKNRVALLLKEYDGVFPTVADQLTLTDGYLSGEVMGEKLEGESLLGKLSVPFCQIKSIQTRVQRAKLTLIPDGKWVEAAFVIDGRVLITASGQVDLWPAQPGTYIAEPNGYSTHFEGYPAGALLGRVDGKVFFVGNRCQADSMGRGKLELKINGTPWRDMIPSGSFEVVVE
jgi:hypothetical protein